MAYSGIASRLDLFPTGGDHSKSCRNNGPFAAFVRMMDRGKVVRVSWLKHEQAKQQIATPTSQIEWL
jgi:hypothetical protein